MVKKYANLKIIGLILAVLVLMILIVFLVGRSFGFFQYMKKGEVINVVAINGLSVNIDNTTDQALNLEDAYPMYDSEGLENDPFTFTITNTSKKSIEYTLKLLNDTDKQAECYVDDNDEVPCTLLPYQYIKYAYSINDGAYSAPANLTNTGNIYTEVIGGNEATKIAIKLWIDSTAPNSIQGNVFFGKLLITGEKSDIMLYQTENYVYFDQYGNGEYKKLKTGTISFTDVSSGKVLTSDLRGTGSDIYYFINKVQAGRYYTVSYEGENYILENARLGNSNNQLSIYNDGKIYIPTDLDDDNNYIAPRLYFRPETYDTLPDKYSLQVFLMDGNGSRISLENSTVQVTNLDTGSDISGNVYIDSDNHYTYSLTNVYVDTEYQFAITNPSDYNYTITDIKVKNQAGSYISVSTADPSIFIIPSGTKDNKQVNFRVYLTLN